MEQIYYSIYNAIQYNSENLGDFFAVKNLLNTENKEIDEIEKILYRHGIIQSEDINLYCYVPGSRAMTAMPNIICFTDFYLVDKNSLEIVRKVNTYPEPNTGLNNLLILCDVDYAKSHDWIDE